jgi:hypothetical protein
MLKQALLAGALVTGAARAAPGSQPEGSATRQPTTQTARQPEPLQPFSAHYSAEWKSLTVGTSDLDLKGGTSPGTYVYTWRITARGIFRLIYSSDVVQKSWFSLHEGHVRPEKYHAEQGASTVDIDFDWERGQATGTSEGRPVKLELVPGLEDVMSIQIEVMLALARGDLPPTFRIVDKDEIKQFDYEMQGPARIRTALGELDTVVVASHRPGNNRVLKMWFAPSMNYLPVQAERARDGRLEFAMRIRPAAALQR